MFGQVRVRSMTSYEKLISILKNADVSKKGDKIPRGGGGCFTTGIFLLLERHTGDEKVFTTITSLGRECKATFCRKLPSSKRVRGSQQFFQIA